MTDENSVKFLMHFKHQVKPTKELPVLVTMLDNHETHLSIEALELAKQNGITAVSFPPYSSHRLQPFGPVLKKRTAATQQNWLRNHPGEGMTIYATPGTAREARNDSMVGRNITAGFQKAGYVVCQNEGADLPWPIRGLTQAWGKSAYVGVGLLIAVFRKSLLCFSNIFNSQMSATCALMKKYILFLYL